MNTSKLTLAQLCKALSDAAEYNRLKAQIIQNNFGRTKMDQGTKRKLEAHVGNHKLFHEESRRLQGVLSAQRAIRNSRGG
jgi:hypothetical protein